MFESAGITENSTVPNCTQNVRDRHLTQRITTFSVWFPLFCFLLAFLLPSFSSSFFEGGREGWEGRGEEGGKECFKATLAFPNETIMVQKREREGEKEREGEYDRYPDDFLLVDEFGRCGEEKEEKEGGEGKEGKEGEQGEKREQGEQGKEGEQGEQGEQGGLWLREWGEGKRRKVCGCVLGEGWCADGLNPHSSYVGKEVEICDSVEEKLTLKKNGFEFVNLGGELEEILKKIQKQKNLDGFRGDLAYEFLFKVISLESPLITLHASQHGFVFRSSAPSQEGEVYRRPLFSQTVHADQDLYGEPLSSLAYGMAPLLFHSLSPIKLVNIWLPVVKLQSRPLVLMDISSLSPFDQLHYHILNPYLKHEFGDVIANDCWAFCHNSTQKWYWKSTLSPGQAVIFDTLKTPHTSCELPCEQLLSSQISMLLSALKNEDSQEREKQLKNVIFSFEEALNHPSKQCVQKEVLVLQKALNFAKIPLTTTTINSVFEDVLELYLSLPRSSVEMRVVALDLQKALFLTGGMAFLLQLTCKKEKREEKNDQKKNK